MSIVWHPKLYVGKMAKEKLPLIKIKIGSGAGTLQVYLLILPMNPANTLEIINGAYLKQPYYQKQQITVVGVAYTYDEALEVFQNLIKDIYTQTGKTDVRAYLKAEV